MTTTTTPSSSAAVAEQDIDRDFYLEEAPTAEARFWDETSTTQTSSSTTTTTRQQRPTGQDQQAWERAVRNRGGIRDANDHSNDNDDNTKIQLIVRASKPAFLADHKWTGSGRAMTTDVVRDRSCEMAKAAERGSAVVRTWREESAKNKMRRKYWELGGSAMGQAIGDKSEAVFMGNDDSRTTQPTATVVGATTDNEDNEIDGPPLPPPSSITNQDLPIMHVLPNLLHVVAENQIVVVVGETGSGKTTRLPIALWKHLKHTGMVGCTQPRRVAAMSVAVRVAEEYGCAVGNEVGYAIRFEDKTSPKTKVKYMTDGVLLRESLRDAELERYSCIVMDEAHERSLNTDVLFGVLKAVVRARRDFRLIVTSATLDADRFATYFGGVEIFRIPGRTFKVETYFSKTPVSDYVDAAVKKVLEIHLTLPPGDILVFMTGQEDITATCELIAERLGQMLAKKEDDEQDQSEAKNKLQSNALILLPMYSTLPSDLQSRIFQPAPPGQRKCVVSTNVAETSLTVDGIKYVIDSGFAKTNVFNPRVGMDLLRLLPISQAAANQRAGRAGRTSEGFCYRLYTDVQFHHELLPMTVPEIQHTNLAAVVLLLKSLGTSNPLDFDFIDPPPLENLIDSMHHLWVLGALDNEGNLTGLGRRMNEFPLEPALSKMLILAHEMGCAGEVVTVVSMLSVPDVFFRPPDRQQEADAAREKFVVPESDHLTLLNTFGQWQRNNKSSTWCAQHFIHAKAMRRGSEVREQLVDSMKKERIAEMFVGPTQWDKVRMCVCASYFANSARMKGIGQYANLLNGIPVYLLPSSSLFGLGFTPDYVVYHELVLTTKEYMRQVTAVEGEWLAQYGPMFFSVRGGGMVQQPPANVAAVMPSHIKRVMPSTTHQQHNQPIQKKTRDDDNSSEEDVLASAREKRAKRGGGLR